MPRRPVVPSIASEFEAARLGDERLARRLTRLASSAAKAPGESFPRMVGSEGELEGVYRFLSNSRVSMDGILQPHIEATRERALSGETLVLHDTTGFAFRGGGYREGLGRLQRSGRAQSKEGFFGHFAFAVSGDGSRLPLGVLGVKTFTRKDATLGPLTSKQYLQLEDKESARWTDLALEVEQTLPGSIHVMDREGDSYLNYRAFIESGLRFIVRGRTGWDRAAERDDGIQGHLPDLVNRTPVLMTRSVRLSRRTPRQVGVLNKNHSPREERDATLAVRAATVSLRRPARFSRRAYGDPVVVNVVLVEEVKPPAGVDPVSWMLMTSEPISNQEELERVVDAYRARWTIEEFFKALKTGCAFEKRQLESLAALKNALAVFSVIAWRLLLLRTVARMSPSASAATVATTRQISILRTLPEIDPRFRDIDLGSRPNATEVLLAVAKLGGHLKRNGMPGWEVLGRGYDAMLMAELGWMARETCDR